MATDKVIGGPLSPQVINQLQLRSDVYSKPSRDNQDLQYISAKTGWVKFTSGVNVGGSDELAKKYILIGGTAGRSGTNTYSNFTGEAGKGFRPMPGITGVQIRSINRFGVLKEATITFNCWDVSQLQELELLYMRPGFTALLEWGHSLYFESPNNFVKTPKTVGSFFTSGTTKEQIYAEIEKLKKESGQNYDGILGFVKNFSWSFRPDGGYDCTTSLISIGEIIESLTIDSDTQSQTEDKSPKGDDTEIDPPTMLENVLKTLKKYGIANGWNKVKEHYPGYVKKFIELNGVDNIVLYKRSGTIVKDTAQKSTIGKTEDFTYITLQVFCQLVNAVLPVDNNKKNLIKLNTKIAPLSSQPNPDNIPTCKFRNFKYQISSDPYICQIITPSVDAWLVEGGTAKAAIDSMRSLKEGSSDEILNIWVNLDNLANIIADVVAKEKGQRTLNDLFQPLFKQLNEVLGGVNDFNFHYEDSTYTYYIVDRQVQVDKSEIPTINVTGLKSTVSQFNFVTKLSPAITTMVAISAQAAAADVGLEAEALLRWNEGLNDRIITKKQNNIEDEQNTAEITAKKLQAQEERLEKLNTALNSFWTGQYIKDQINTAKINFVQYATTYVQFYDDEGQSSNQKAGPAGIIPFEVNITMDGISGIKIGQTFQINQGVMPNKYYGVIGFIVTGIDHDIQNNRWVTNLKAQTVVLANKVKGSGPVNANSGQNAQGISTTEVKGLRSSRPTSAKKIASFGKVSDSVPSYAKPILDTIAYTEGTAGAGTNGYDIIVGFGQIEGWTENYDKGHPNKLVQLNKTLSSTAAGRYQFLKDTWKGLKLNEFNKSNQDLGGWNLVQAKKSAEKSYNTAKTQIQNGKIDAYANTGFLSFLDNNYAVWASLVNSSGKSRYSGQDGGLSPADIYEVYIKAVQKYV